MSARLVLRWGWSKVNKGSCSGPARCKAGKCTPARQLRQGSRRKNLNLNTVPEFKCGTWAEGEDTSYFLWSMLYLFLTTQLVRKMLSCQWANTYCEIIFFWAVPLGRAEKIRNGKHLMLAYCLAPSRVLSTEIYDSHSHPCWLSSQVPKMKVVDSQPLDPYLLFQTSCWCCRGKTRLQRRDVTGQQQ